MSRGFDVKLSLIPSSWMIHLCFFIQVFSFGFFCLLSPTCIHSFCISLLVFPLSLCFGLFFGLFVCGSYLYLTPVTHSYLINPLLSDTLHFFGCHDISHLYPAATNPARYRLFIVLY
jgi:hypothetical protein